MTLRLAIPRNAEYDDSGNPLAGGKLRFSIVGTSTPKNTFSDPGLTTPNANPVVADASGRFGDIYLTTGQYKVELLTAADVVIWTADNVDGNPAAGTIGATTVTGTLTLQAALNEAARVSVASASTTNIGAAASSSVLITGTTTINAFDNVAAGIRRHVTFAASLTLTHNATSLILPGGANITTQANDTAEFLSLGSGNWLCENYKRQSGRAIIDPSQVLQIVESTTGAVATGTTVIPQDDTIPQSGEGDQYLSLAITPKVVGSIIRIEFELWASVSATARNIVASLFKDAETDARMVRVANANTGSINTPTPLQGSYNFTTASLSAITWNVRAGLTGAGTLTVNGSAAARLYGGAGYSFIRITEFLPAVSVP